MNKGQNNGETGSSTYNQPAKNPAGWRLAEARELLRSSFWEMT